MMEVITKSQGNRPEEIPECHETHEEKGYNMM